MVSRTLGRLAGVISAKGFRFKRSEETDRDAKGGPHDRSDCNPMSPLWQSGSLPIVGIVTPVRNRIAWSVSFVQQILAQSYPFIRIYVVDASSTDGTPLAIQALGHPAVRLIPVSSSNYWTGATNEGVSCALADGCDYIITLNDDAIVPRGFVETLVSTAIRRGIKILGSMISYSHEPGRIWGAGSYNDWSAGNFLQTKFANTWYAQQGELGNEVIEAECLCGNGTLIEASVFEKIGVYNSKFTPHYHADTEFTLRARRYGINSFVATKAWIYNRFYESTDGAMTARNRRYFSLRSANYLRPILFVLQQYCPSGDRVVAFCKYVERYLFDADQRTISRLVRCAFFLSDLSAKGEFTGKNFYSSGSRELDFCSDLHFTLQLKGREFLMVSAMLLLRRQFTDVEKKHYLQYVETEESRRLVLLDLMKRPEFMAWGNVTPEVSLLLGNSKSDPLLFKNSSDVSFAIGALLSSYGKLPNSRQFREVLDLLLTKPRGLLYPHLSSSDGNSVGAPPCIESEQEDNVQKPVVYVNGDVLCMAELDSRARTGVFRYVEAIVDQILDEGKVIARIFHSSDLDDGWEKVVRRLPHLSHYHVDKPIRPSNGSRKDIVFYPYFPFSDFDPRFLDQKRVFTLCDLFPATNPEWFTKEATTNFLRQLRHLPSADHIICISAETEKNLRRYAPTLKGSTSVAYLGVRTPVWDIESAVTKPDFTPPGRYMLCIGTLEPRKNLATVIKAMTRLQQTEFADVHLVVVGASGWNVNFAEEAKSLDGKIVFLGHVEDEVLWKLYRSAVCTVFPSLAEGFGFPIVESFASGTPVITSNLSSMKEIAGEDAILVDPLDDADLCRAMVSLLSNPDQGRALAIRGLQRAHEFSWGKCLSSHVSEFVRVYQEA